MRRLVLLGGIVGVAAGLLGWTTSGGAQQPGGQTFTLLERRLSYDVVDNPPRSKRRFSKGDIISGNASVRDASNRKIGRVQSYCVITHSTRPYKSQCSGTFALQGGTLTFSGIIPGAEEATIPFAVTGGTGTYEGARGTITADCGTDTCDDTVHLLP